jgi:hypothetical protein
VFRSIRFKLIVPLVAGLAIIAVAIAVLMRFVHQRGVEQAALHEVQQAASVLAAIEVAEQDRLSGLLQVIERDQSLQGAFARGDRAAVLAEAEPLLGRLRDAHGVTHWTFHPPDPAAGAWLRVHRPALHGDVVRRPSFLQAVATGAEARGLDLGQTAYAVRVVRPWRQDGRLIGYVELGSSIQAFLARLGRLTGDEFGVLLDKRRLDRPGWERLGGPPEAWDDRAELIAVGHTGPDGALLAGLVRMDQVPSRPALLGREVHDGRTWSKGIFPLLDGAGQVIGAVVARHEISPLLAGVDELRLQVVVLVVLLATALSALVVFLLETLVFEPVARMSRKLEALPERMARGEWQALESPPRSEDELGRFEAFLDQALAAVGSFVTDVRRAPGRPGERERRPDDDRDR